MKYLRLVVGTLIIANAWTVSAQAQSGCPCSLWPDATTPAIADAGADDPVELGVKFTPQVDGLVTGIRFYKSAANGGIHIGNLWSEAGTLLGSVTFQNETASGWQQAALPVAVGVTAGATYVVSYHMMTGHYAHTSDYFFAATTSGPLQALAGATSPNGVYKYGVSAFPNTSYRSSNYWVDLLFAPYSGDAPAVVGTSPITGGTDAAPPFVATFRSEMLGTSIVMSLRDSGGALVPASVTYAAGPRSAALTPRDPLAAQSMYTATVESATAADGRRLESPYAWTFTTGVSGFRESIMLSGLNNPTTFEWVSGGLIFVAEKSGIIKVFEGFGDTTPVVFADLRTEIHNFWDRGLMGMAVHPDFPNQPYVYVAYTHNAPIGGVAPVWGSASATSQECTDPSGAGCVVSGRVSRLRAAPVAGGYVMTGPEEVLVEDWGQQFPSHSVGAVKFGPDGALYASGGDGASYTVVDYGQMGNPPNPLGDPPGPVGSALAPPGAEGGALRSQSLRRANGGPVLLNGTIIRIDPATGAGLPDNPLSGSTSANARRIIALGLRNPFRFTFRPGSSEIWVGDVGWSTWEELNRITNPTAGVTNFGWPCYEGVRIQPGYETTNLALCQGLYAEYGAVTPPIFTYNHGEKVVAGEPCRTGGSSTSGVAFYPGGAYPPAYTGALLFADYARGCIWAMLSDANGVPDPERRATISSTAAGPVDLKISTGGDVYYVDFVGGTIRRVQYAAFAGALPTAQLTVTPAQGAAPLAVDLDGSGSTGGGASSLTYSWDFGDGTTLTSGPSRTSHTYAAGTFVARLTVGDTAGQTSSATASISAGTSAPTAIIDSPAASRTWQVGESIAFSGRGTDAEDGALAPAALTWSLILQHCSDLLTCHAHPVQDFAGVAAGTFAAPDHEYPSYLELRLTARDSSGLASSTTVRLDPRTVGLTFDTTPSGLTLAVGSSASVTPFTRTVIVGSSLSVSAATPQTRASTTYTFSSWSDNGTQSHQIVAPATPASYVASYTAQASNTETSLFTSADLPAVADGGADSPVELGLKFRADMSGTVLGVRFYKCGLNGGIHVGSLWTTSGTRLAFVTFSNETASGWQEARFSAPVAIGAGTIYIVSYHSTGGHYAYTPVYFGAALDRGALHAPASAATQNGVYRYGSAGSFPTNSYNATNYWVDVVFQASVDSTAPLVISRLPAANATAVNPSQPITATFNEALTAGSVTTATVQVRDAAGALVAGTVSWDAAGLKITFSPSSALTAGSRYSVRLAGAPAAGVIQDVAGNALAADVTWSFDTAATATGGGAGSTLWAPTAVPAVIDAGPDSSVELGVRFRTDTDGVIRGIRFYKSTANTGPHVANLWSASGVLLATATFSSETASGWQEVTLATPVAVVTGATYVASYHTTVGHYSYTGAYFPAGYDNAPLHALPSTGGGNGLYQYGGAGSFPTASYNASNYWVDVVFQAAVDTTAPLVMSTLPAANATAVNPSQPITATFNEALNAGSVTTATMQVRDAAGALVAGTVNWDAAGLTITFNASSALTAGSRYSVRVAGAPAAGAIQDVAGNALAADVAWSFDTAATPTGGAASTLWSPTAVPAVIDGGPDSPVALGVRFRTDTDGVIRGIRYYKSTANTGPHVANLWSASGALLATATFSSETASGWQEVTFATPVAIVAGTTYVASYHATVGHYSYSGAYFPAGYDNAPLHALPSAGGGNGVYQYGGAGSFPTASYNASNYWVDVVFTPQ